MTQRLTAPLLALVLTVLLALPLAAQNATPEPRLPGQRTVTIPDARPLALSPDGAWLAATKPVAARATHLCVYDANTLAERACGDLSGLQAGLRLDDVVWSPDSTHLAFGDEAFRFLVDGDLWLMDAANGAVTNLTDDGFDGSLPFFSSERAPSEPIYVDILPAWTPDGQAITFSRSPIIGGHYRGNQIAQVDLVTGQVRTLLPVTLDVPGIVYYGLTWSRNGERLYVSLMYPAVDNPANGVYEHDFTAGTSRRVVGSDPELGPPAIMEVNASGESALLFYPIAAGRFASAGPLFALLDLATGQTTPLAPANAGDAAGGSVRLATFSPDGQRLLLAIVAADQTSALVIRNLDDGSEQTVAGGLPRITPSTFGRGLTWATNGTIFAPTGNFTGLLLRLAALAPPPAPPSGG